jgi:ubiquinone/menaquinone biosynthesis C-methylase UbiE
MEGVVNGSATMESRDAVSRYFDAATEFWNDVYRGTDVNSVIYQERRSLALGWVDDLRLSAGAKVLEVGCGAAGTAVALAERAFDVDAVDAAPAMIELARRQGDQSPVGALIRTRLANVQALDFPDGTFDLVIALGVVPWLTSPATALREGERVLKPGGSFIGTCDNDARLNRLLDPKANPRLAGMRAVTKRMLGRTGVEFPDRAPLIIVRRHSIAEFDRLVACAGLERVRGRTFGFGPFTLLGPRGRPRPSRGDAPSQAAGTGRPRRARSSPHGKPVHRARA